MQRLSLHRYDYTFNWHYAWFEVGLSICLALLVFVAPTSAAMRFQERSLFMRDNEPGVTTDYTVSFRFMSPDAVGSVDLLFCEDPIPHHECVPPPGLDVANATLSEQSGETGFSILSQTSNHIILTRSPEIISDAPSSYTFEDIVNPSETGRSFSIRLRSHVSADASGPQIDFGSVVGQVRTGIVIETQVPPMLIFCVAHEVRDNCASTNGIHYADMGNLDHQNTLTAQSEMAVGTNASGGFVIAAYGASMSAGLSVIAPLSEPTESQPGVNQFGINLVANTAPEIGSDPEGEWANAVPSPDYAIPDHYKFIPGSVIASSPNVSLMKKFTVSYIVNSAENLRPGVYTTTITYIASGQF